jgi:hypothetical protein
MSQPCLHHVKALPAPCHSPACTMSQPCLHPVTALPAPCRRDVMPCMQSLQSLLLLMQSSPYNSYVEAVQHSMRAYALPGCEAGSAGRAAPLLQCRHTHRVTGIVTGRVSGRVTGQITGSIGTPVCDQQVKHTGTHPCCQCTSRFLPRLQVGWAFRATHVAASVV